jgi:hypothetical protein
MDDPHSLLIHGEALKIFFEEQELCLTEEVLPVKKKEAGEENTSEHRFIWEGSDTGGLWMIFDHEENTALHSAWKDLITGLVENPKAMNKKLSEIACMNIRPNKALDWHSLVRRHQVKKVIFWGEISGTPATALTLYTPESREGITLMRADIPEKIKQDKALKNQLWVQIQKAFL